MTELDEWIRYHREIAAEHKAIANAMEDGTYTALMQYPHAWVPVSWVGNYCGISPQAANNRMRKLYDVGVCRRRRITREGKTHEYHWLVKPGTR